MPKYDEINKKYDEDEEITPEETDEDDDQRFITDQQQNLEDAKKDLEEAQEYLEGIIPENWHQRNLDRETGGLEAKDPKNISTKDAWDNRAAQISQDNLEQGTNLNNASKSSLRKSFIHRKKQKEKQEDVAKDALESHAQRVKNRGKGNGERSL